MGMLNGTWTGLPLCFPGVMFGNKEIIRLASPSRYLSGPRILILVILPSSEMIKFTNTRPCIPISWGISGYRLIHNQIYLSHRFLTR